MTEQTLVLLSYLITGLSASGMLYLAIKVIILQVTRRLDARKWARTCAQREFEKQQAVQALESTLFGG